MGHKKIGYTFQESADYRESWRIFRIMAEFVDGYQLLASLDKEVTILGSARIPQDDYFYKETEKLGGLLGKAGFTVVTGGGPSIMEAANKGAYEAGGRSVGLNIQLPFEQVLNRYVTHTTSFSYFFTRKVMLTAPAQAFVFCPGGFGTLDEFFEVVDHMDLGFMTKVPIVLMGEEFWSPLLTFLRERCVRIGSIDLSTIDSWHIVNTADEAFDIIKNSPMTQRSCDLSARTFHCYDNIDWRVFRIMAELVEGFDFMTGIKDGITVLGTKSVPYTHQAYGDAFELGRLFAKKGYPIITGGKQGIAEAVARGSSENGGITIGIDLDETDLTQKNTQSYPSYFTKSIRFQFPFTRKQIITAPSRAFVFFPGGFGTLHQLFEVLTLLNTKKIPRLPVVLFDRAFWQPLHWFIKNMLVHEFETIADEDDELYQIVDHFESIDHVIRYY